VRAWALILLLAVAACSGMPRSLSWPVTGVVDGDTLRVRIDTLPGELADVSVRVRGIDTPERGQHANCARERRLAEDALRFTKGALERAKLVEFRNLGWDKYGGRVLADVLLDGRPLSDMLIAAGLARQYFGVGPKPNWCLPGRDEGRA